MSDYNDMDQKSSTDKSGGRTIGLVIALILLAIGMGITLYLIYHPEFEIKVNKNNSTSVVEIVDDTNNVA